MMSITNSIQAQTQGYFWNFDKNNTEECGCGEKKGAYLDAPVICLAKFLK